MSPTSLYDFEIILDFFAGKKRVTVVMGGVTFVRGKNIVVGASK